MGRPTLNYSHGDAGSKPADGTDFISGEAADPQQFDWYIDQLTSSIDALSAEFDRLDTDDDGIVDKADGLAAAATIDGDLSAVDGELIWDETNGYIPQGSLSNDALTVTAGDGLKGGGTISLGGSATINIEPADFAGGGVVDDGSDNIAHADTSTQGNVSAGAGAAITDINVDGYGHVTGLGTTDFDSRFVLESGDTMSGALYMSGNDVNSVSVFRLTDADGDGNYWRFTEDGSDGHLVFSSINGGGKQMDLEHNGNLRIEGELSEGAAL